MFDGCFKVDILTISFFTVGFKAAISAKVKGLKSGIGTLTLDHLFSKNPKQTMMQQILWKRCRGRHCNSGPPAPLVLHCFRFSCLNNLDLNELFCVGRPRFIRTPCGGDIWSPAWLRCVNGRFSVAECFHVCAEAGAHEDRRLAGCSRVDLDLFWTGFSQGSSPGVSWGRGVYCWATVAITPWLRTAVISAFSPQ